MVEAMLGWSVRLDLLATDASAKRVALLAAAGPSGSHGGRACIDREFLRDLQRPPKARIPEA
jgi:hypothetical protein